MSNMSYCQLRNTSDDFEKCMDAIGNASSIDDFSPPEQAAASDIYDMAQKYISWYEQLIQE